MHCTSSRGVSLRTTHKPGALRQSAPYLDSPHHTTPDRIVGGIVSCCKKSMCGLVTFTVTSWISLILRLVALVVISMWTDYFNTYCDDE